MIVTNIIGGLGNQLFQYAIGKALALKNNTELKIDIRGFNDYFRRFLLDKFDIKISIASEEEIQACRLVQEKQSFVFDPEVLSLGDNVYLQGYWQSEKYFKDIEDVIRKEFRSIVAENFGMSYVEASNMRAPSISGNFTYVAVHYRRTDYLNIADVAEICDDTYYQRTKAHIYRYTKKQPIFLYFSDDQKWLEENKKEFQKDGYIIRTNNPLEALKQMIECDHHIIANSTFSWWGAWLNDKTDKIVLAPQRWHRRLPTPDIYPEKWKGM